MTDVQRVKFEAMMAKDRAETAKRQEEFVAKRDNNIIHEGRYGVVRKAHLCSNCGNNIKKGAKVIMIERRNSNGAIYTDYYCGCTHIEY